MADAPPADNSWLVDGFRAARRWLSIHPRIRSGRESGAGRPGLSFKPGRRAAVLVGVAVAIAATVGYVVLRFPARWQVVTSSGISGLTAVTCAGTDDCWAVGDNAVAHYSGGGWAAFPPAVVAVQGYNLDGIACIGPGDCWAVGGFTSGHGGLPLLEHYAEGGGAVVQGPAIAGWKPGWAAGLSSISCVPSGDCWAVGSITSQLQSEPYEEPLIERFSDGTWRVADTPQLAEPAGWLSAVTCADADDCWAVGQTPNNGQALVERYSEGAWTVVSSPTLSEGGMLNAVACTEPTDCWAVGSTNRKGGAQATYIPEPLVEEFARGAWTVAATPAKDWGALAGVACISSSQCWAVGSVNEVVGLSTMASSPSPSLPPPVIERFEDGRWALVTAPSTPGELSGVACGWNGHCWAVGSAPFAGPSLIEAVQ